MHRLIFAMALPLLACESKAPSLEKLEAMAPAQGAARMQLTDLTTTSTLEPVRKVFNAHKAEARFLTLLSPT